MMKRLVYLITLVSLISCDTSKQKAQQHLVNARGFLSQDQFGLAKNELDSLNQNYPKAFEERKQSISLLDSIRKAENNYILTQLIPQYDSITSRINNLKKNFRYQIDKKYQDEGIYIPRNITSNPKSTSLETGVSDSGEMYIKSNYIGSQKHDRIKVLIEDNSAESLPITSDGFVHRFSNLGTTYEIMYIRQNYNNGIFSLIAENVDDKIIVELIGNQSYKYVLGETAKKAIFEVYQLSSEMILLDSIKTEIEKTKYKNFYLDHERNSSIQRESTK